MPVRAEGGIPSLERALGNPETAGVAAWLDTPADAAWTSPDPGDVLRAMDRFHAVPDVPARADSWAEWLYFKGQVRRRCSSTSPFLPARSGPAAGALRACASSSIAAAA